MNKFHNIEGLDFVEDTMILSVDGQQYKFRLKDISKRLANASNLERERYEISPSGYGIHWTLIDEDISIDGLLGITHAPLKIKDKVVA